MNTSKHLPDSHGSCEILVLIMVHHKAVRLIFDLCQTITENAEGLNRRQSIRCAGKICFVKHEVKVKLNCHVRFVET
jgi:hypothetical protein